MQEGRFYSFQSDDIAHWVEEKNNDVSMERFWESKEAKDHEERLQLEASFEQGMLVRKKEICASRAESVSL